MAVCSFVDRGAPLLSWFALCFQQYCLAMLFVLTFECVWQSIVVEPIDLDLVGSKELPWVLALALLLVSPFPILAAPLFVHLIANSPLMHVDVTLES